MVIGSEEVPSVFMWTVVQELAAGGPTLKTHLNINSHAKHEGFRLPFSGELRMRIGVTQSFSSFAPYLHQEDRLNKESLGLSSSCTKGASEATERDFHVAEQGAHQPLSGRKVGFRPSEKSSPLFDSSKQDEQDEKHFLQ